MNHIFLFRKLSLKVLLILSIIASASSLSFANESNFEDSKKSETNGVYIFVPDSMKKDVVKLLTGRGRLASADEHINQNEKVLWHGDTVPMVLASRNFGRFNRGLWNYLYIPKGQWSVGATASYGEFSTSDLNLFDVISDVSLGANAFSINPYLLYSVRNNIMVGVRFGYSSINANIDRFNLNLMDDMNFNLNQISYGSDSYSGALLLRQYIGITRRGRFAVFNEAELAFSGGNSSFKRPYGDEAKETEVKHFQTALNFSPGVSVFMMDNVSFNVAVGVMGLYVKKERVWENGEDIGSRIASGANFRLNLFNIKFGIGIHI